MAILIAYGSIEGQTGKIARFIEKLLVDRGEDVRLFDTSDRHAVAEFEGANKVILAGSVHERRHPKDFEVFLMSHQEDLDKRNTLLLSVSLSAAFPEGIEEAQDYVDEMKMRTDLDPDEEMLVPGAVKTKRYDYFATQVLRHVVLRGRNFDPAVQEHEFTNWDDIAAKVVSFSADSENVVL